MNGFVFAKSAGGIPIPAYQFGHSGPHLLVLGGVHGDESEGVIAAQGLLNEFLQTFPWRFQLTLVPMFNIDGVLNRARQNSNGVDLNRNLPTRDWTNQVENPRYYPGEKANSEPENQALTQWIQTYHPSFILSLHSWHPMLNVNGDCVQVAKTISQWTGYKIVETIGYPTPGCLGTYTGVERKIPTLTYEIERGLGSAEILRTHVPAILESFKYFEENR